MIQVAGTTYRIRSEVNRHLVFRVIDDRNVGAFQHQPALRIVESEVEPLQLLEVAKAALQTGRLPWTRVAAVSQPSVQLHARVEDPPEHHGAKGDEPALSSIMKRPICFHAALLSAVSLALLVVALRMAIQCITGVSPWLADSLGPVTGPQAVTHRGAD